MSIEMEDRVMCNILRTRRHRFDALHALLTGDGFAPRRKTPPLRPCDKPRQVVVTPARERVA